MPCAAKENECAVVESSKKQRVFEGEKVTAKTKEKSDSWGGVLGPKPTGATEKKESGHSLEDSETYGEKRKKKVRGDEKEDEGGRGEKAK